MSWLSSSKSCSPVRCWCCSDWSSWFSFIFKSSSEPFLDDFFGELELYFFEDLLLEFLDDFDFLDDLELSPAFLGIHYFYLLPSYIGSFLNLSIASNK